MSRSAPASLRLAVGPLACAAALILGSVPALAQTAPTASSGTSSSSATCSGIKFELANPSPGAMLNAGGLIVEGVAMDTRANANQGNGIDRVDFFLNSREAGGQSIGSAVPGMVQGPFGAGSFQTTIELPSSMTGGGDIVAYAHSSVTGQESVISVPVVVGESPTVAGVTSVNGSTAPSIQSSCMGAPQSTTAPTTTVATTPSTTTTTTTTTTTAVTPARSTITLEVGNPSSGDTVLTGGYTMEGIAYDAAAQQGLGIDRIDIFLDSRDDGGTRIGGAMLGTPNPRAAAGSQFGQAGWRAMVTLPNNQQGLHTLFVYAHSAVTGQESVIQVPITVTL